LHSGGSQDAHPSSLCEGPRKGKQRGFPDAGLAAKHECPTTFMHVVEQIVKDADRAIAPN
jgi:hypothetical protein